ncbi:MAG: hypothetical protein HYZ15_10740 [Sphingobacteriales bacterium]|nr:hypothetical protein [Sphingobacteriales bacterium]
MPRRFSLFVLILTCLARSASAQTVLPDFTGVDSLARSVRFRDNIYELTRELTAPYTDKLPKVRSIFIWITDNIRYDYKFFNKGEEIKVPACRGGQDCDEVMANWEKKFLTTVLRKRKAVCEGYALLFTRMCDIAGIEAATINGYTRTQPYEIGHAGPIDHAWNAVWLDSSWHLLDPTWAAGVCTEDENSGKLNGFQKKYNNYYFLTSFEEFSRNHFPQYTRWVLKPGYTKDKFAANPYYDPATLSRIRLLSPQSGMINGQKGDTIHFKFDYTGQIEKLQVNSNLFRNPDIWGWEQVSKRKKVWVKDTFAVKRQRYVSFVRKGDRVEFDFIIPENSLYYLDILFDYQRVMRFKVVIDKKGK